MEARILTRRDPARAQRLLQEALALTDEPTARVESLTVLSILQSEVNGDPAARATAREAVAGCGDTTPPQIEGRALFGLALAHVSVGDYPDALEALEAAESRARDARDLILAIDIQVERSGIHHRHAEFLRALEQLQDGLARCRRTGHRLGEATTLTRLGHVFDRLGEYDRALDVHQRALAIREEIEDRLGEAISLGAIANIYLQMEQFREGIGWQERSIALSRERGFTKHTATALGNLALLYMGLEDWQQARRYHEESLVHKLQTGNRQGEANTRGNLANVLLEQGHIDDAHQELDRAIQLNRALGDRYSEAHNALTLGRLHDAQGSLREAIDALDHALALAETVGSQEMVFRIHEVFHQIYRRRRRYARALEHHERYHAAYRAVFTDRMSQRARSLQVLHQVDEARKTAEQERHRTAQLTDALAMTERQAREDVLTGLLNRRAGDERLGEEFERARRYGHALSVVIADIDHFKRINDTFSHQIGDSVLRVVSRCLRESCRSVDCAVRYGGEEFVLVLPETAAAAAEEVCERLRKTVQHYDWEQVHQGLQVTLSIGICDDTQLGGPEQMLSTADSRLYAAKRAGRNRVRR
jgi:diguanylate cyclase (GGDEF)-like protein